MNIIWINRKHSVANNALIRKFDYSCWWSWNMNMFEQQNKFSNSLPLPFPLSISLGIIKAFWIYSHFIIIDFRNNNSDKGWVEAKSRARQYHTTSTLSIKRSMAGIKFVKPFEHCPANVRYRLLFACTKYPMRLPLL